MQLSDQVFHDEMCWDLGDPQNTPHKYASAVCYDLGLSWAAAPIIAAAIELQLQSSSEVGISLQLCGSVLGVVHRLVADYFYALSYMVLAL